MYLCVDSEPNPKPVVVISVEVSEEGFSGIAVGFA